MQSNTRFYSFESSLARMDEILDAADAAYAEVDSIPDRDSLTFTNGFYVNCSALFVDIRDSSKLGENHRRPTLAKLYRAYISELVALFNGESNCREVNIHGDAVWGVFNCPWKTDIDALFALAAEAHSLVDALNVKLQKRSISTIRVGIGLAYGRALMIKAGHKGSTINDVVWMGDVVNEAAHLASYGNKSWGDRTIMASRTIYDNLTNDDYKALLDYSYARGCYHSNAINIHMNNWVEGQLIS